MRIVGGKHRGRKLAAPAGKRVRPTSDRAREAVFNILSHGRFADSSPISGKRVCDAFCGTGAMGLEALSRGAAHATFLDSDPAVLEIAKENAEKLGETQNARFVRADATRPPKAPAPCGLLFLDPPYGSGLAQPALAALGRAGWIAEDAVVVVEVGAREKFAAPQGFETLDERRYGAARVILLAPRKTESA
ncbi:MAG: 16S rRNA (guanine(966)-N(2))-methyltransferase RsmD [Alphaproteobacteria bacterium]